MNMIQVNVNDLIGPALDWAVAQALGLEVKFEPMISDGSFWTIKHAPFPDTPNQRIGFGYSPSTKWDQAGPIVDEAKIDLAYCSHDEPPHWRAGCCQPGSAVGLVAIGPTALVAAMRAFVLNRLGDPVDVPESLAGDAS
jgi:hypothetical protein